jgi:hypothetical protein
MARADLGNPQGVSTEDEHDDEQARIKRAESLREAIREMQGGRRARPRTPRDFTEERAREAAAEERERLEGTGDDEDDENR